VSGPLANPRHEAFVRELAKGKSATEAYVAAGYKESRQHAARLATNGDIVARLAALQNAVAEKTVHTVERLIDKAEEARLLAMEIKQPAAAVTAILGIARLRGFLVDKPAEVTVTNNFAAFIDAPPRESYEEWCARRARDDVGGVRASRALESPKRAAARRDTGDMG
jgi:hypothetical protein